MLQKSYRRTWWFPWQQIDWLLLGLVIIISVYGTGMIYSTELAQAGTRAWQQGSIATVGLVVALAIARWRYELLLQLHWLTYIITNAALIFVVAAGVTVNGAQSWIDVGGFNLQPSEFAKVGVIVTLAALLHHRDASTLWGMVRVLLACAIPWCLIMLQPDLGTSLVFGAITIGMLFWANTNPGWLLILISPLVSAILFNVYFNGWIFWAVVVTIIAWFTLPWRALTALGVFGVNLGTGKLSSVLWGLLKDYQKDRLLLFLDPEKDPLGGGYHLIQSRIAIGSGGVWGKGLHQGTQTQLNFIPEQHTDFIFSAIGEELGFIGCLALLLLLWLICLRLIMIACSAKENFGSLLAIGVLSMIAFQSILNICMTIGLAPITGIPLPWMSYGGSSLLTNFIAIGIVESVANYRQPKNRY